MNSWPVECDLYFRPCTLTKTIWSLGRSCAATRGRVILFDRVWAMVGGGGSWKLMRGVVSTKEKLYTLKILHRLAALKVPSTTLTTAPSFKPSIMWSSAKSSSRTPSICSEKHVLWQLSGRSRTTCRRSCTLSRRENWRRHEMKNKAVLIFMKNSSPW